jgi:hypothetical protein
MRLFKQARAHAAEHETVTKRLDANETRIVDMAKRLVRLEAEVDIYRPFFVDDEKGRE